MVEQLKNAQKQSKKVQQFLHRTQGYALWHKKYRWAIDLYERYKQRHPLSDNQAYRLGLLYDHLAMVTRSGSMGDSTENEKSVNRYASQAEVLYRDILRRNPRFFLAWYGLGRVQGIRGKYAYALRCQRRAYRGMLKLPRHKRAALGIGLMYEMQGKPKRAEGWYQREALNAPRNDYGTTANLMHFYRRQKEYWKALPYALKVEKLLSREYRKKRYAGFGIHTSGFLVRIKEEIKEIKREAGFMGRGFTNANPRPSVTRRR